MRISTILAVACLMLVSCQPEQGCTDFEALNFNPDAVEDDGGCEYNLNECPSSPDGLFTGSCAPVTYDGYTYDVVLIGDQCWFAENLRSTRYSNGDLIAQGLTWSEYGQIKVGAVSVYGNLDPDESVDLPNDYCESHALLGYDACDPDVSLELFGRLYNWYAVIDHRGLCPSGWHVPTDGEWTALETEVSGSSIRAELGWHPSYPSFSNETGFSVRPGGYRMWGGPFREAGWWGFFWSSCEYTGSYYPDGYANAELVGENASEGDDNGSIVFNGYKKNSGLSVRCIKD